MLVYFVAYGIISLFTFFMTVKNIRRQSINKAVAILSFVIFVAILGLRHPSMGVDLGYGKSSGYLASFNKLSKMTWGQIFTLETYLNYEWGYILFNKIVGSIWQNEQFFLFICAFVSLAPVFYVIYKRSNNTFMSVVIMLGLPSYMIIYSGLRQAIAVGICFLALGFIQDRKFIKFIIAVIIAGLFHSSAFIFLIAYPLYYIKLSYNTRLLSVLVLPVIFLLKNVLFNIFSKLFKENAAIEETGSLTLFLVFCLVYVFCIVLYNGSKKQNGLMNLFFFACCCQAFGSVYNTAMRVGYYFMVALTLLLSDSMQKAKIEEKERSLISLVIYVSFIAFGLYSIFNSSWAGAYPHIWFWENVV